MTLTGHCLCNRTRFELDPPFLFVGHCHCESCRRQTASAFTTFIGVEQGQWRWTGAPPVRYESGPGRTRWFCAGCGAPAAYANEVDSPGEMHFYAALLDDPEAVVPEMNFHPEEHLSWAFDAPSLPVYRRDGE
ncbi:GFA family protein [Poseidonocella sp. HB161398]|uniref:GFA family protein n=1 Tax=Poseidonocella sp. HB161398 TaxID=2320855 RepID=UPI0011096418|nr:GFA family protein [Poseidonocella sp. HB161398]